MAAGMRSLTVRIYTHNLEHIQSAHKLMHLHKIFHIHEFNGGMEEIA